MRAPRSVDRNRPLAEPHATARSGVVARVACRSVSIEADWHTFYTGRQPSEHGHCSYDEIIPGTYRSRMTTAPRTVYKPFWETLSQEGAQVIAFNPVHAAPSPVANGIVITDWLVHDAGHYGSRRATHRSSLLSCSLAIQGIRSIRTTGAIPPMPIRTPSRRQNARHCAASWRFLTELLQSRAWDVCYVGFDECHEMSHLFWHIHDPFPSAP